MCFWVSPILPTWQRPVLLLPALPLLTVAHILTWLASDPRTLWSQLPCTSHKGAGREKPWPGLGALHSPLLPRASTLWGRVRHKDGSFHQPHPPPSGLSPSPSLGWQRPKKTELLQLTLTLSLPHFLLQEDGLLPPPPWLQTWPWCQVSPEFPEAEALPRLRLDPSPFPISPLPSFFLPQPRVLCTSLPIVNILL